jgi:hypothetical protein
MVTKLILAILVCFSISLGQIAPIDSIVVNDTTKIYCFDKEMFGGVKIFPQGSVRVRFGETANETMMYPEYEETEWGYNQDWMISDTLIHGRTGFRFVSLSGHWSNVKAYPEPEYFEIPGLNSGCICLDTIFKVGVRTAVLCRKDSVYWDGIKRDKCLWSADLYIEAKTIREIYGNDSAIAKTLRNLNNRSFNEAINGYVNWSPFWILTGYDSYKTGITPDTVSMFRRLDTLLTHVIGGNENILGHGDRLLSWSAQNNANATHAGTQALLAMSLDACIDLCGYPCGNPRGIRYKDYADSIRSVTVNSNGNIMAWSLCKLAGLSDTGSEPSWTTLITPFDAYFYLEVLAKQERWNEAKEMICGYWGGMIHLGATSFWEFYNIGWQNSAHVNEYTGNMLYMNNNFCSPTSACHGWSSGVSYWLWKYKNNLDY